MSHAPERRISPRLAAKENRSLLEFGTPSGRQRVPATLLDISREGALIVAEEAPALHGTGWVRMDHPARTDWIAAVAVRHGEANWIGIRFVHPCPDDFLMAALLGIDLGPTLLGGPRSQSVDDFDFRW